LAYYGIISIAVAMFSVQFLFNQKFEKEYGNDLRAMLVFSAGTSLAGLIVLLLINGFELGCTPFALIMCIIGAINGMIYTFCSLKVLGKINLSLYSVFAMLGGMALPFATGILFYGEPLTVGKCICFAIVAASLFLTVKKGDSGFSGGWYYAGVFVLNGMNGVLSKIFQDAPYAKPTAAGYAALGAVVSLVMAVALLFFVKGEKRPLSLRAVGSMVGYGLLSRIGNWLLLIALAVLPASAQYPFVTGGVMILSTAISYFTPQKPNKRELIAVALSFVGLLILMFVP